MISNISLWTLDRVASNKDRSPIMGTTLVAIAPDVLDSERLIAGVRSGVTAIVLQPKDPIAQITRALNAAAPVSSLHLISHGSPGCLHLGKTRLNRETLEHYLPHFQQWRQALAENAEILIYGCNVAAEVSDQTESPTLIHRLRQLTGAKIAASTNRTGNSTLGGDWNLTYRIGELASPLAFTQETMQTYCGVLANFDTATNFGVGEEPREIAVADINKDGNLDLVTSDRDSDQVSVLLGDGNGSFGAATSFTVGALNNDDANNVAIADVNRDGNLDIVAANRFENTISLLLGDGTGNFGSATNFAVGTGPVDLVVKDFDSDGNLDLATVNRDAGNVSVLLGDGAGNFSNVTGSPFSVSGVNPQEIDFGDFNRDGNLDLAVANSFEGGTSPDVSVLFGNGDGTFGPAQDFSVGGNQAAIAVADFNIDGNLDIAVALNSNNTVAVLLGDGAGNFGAASEFAVGNLAGAIAIADANGDGFLDLATSNRTDDTVSLLLGDGTGNFGSAIAFTVGDDPFALAFADFNKDGQADLAVPNRLSENVSVLLNIIPRITVTAGTTPRETGPTNGTFEITLDHPAPTEGLVVNFDLINSTAATPGHYEFAAGTNITEVTASTFTIAAGETTATLQVVPVDDDLINPGETVELRIIDGERYLLGDPTAAFVNARKSGSFRVGNEPSEVEVADLNGDGNLDLAVANASSNNVSVLLGNGDGSFGAASNFSVGNSPRYLAFGDFNVDGILDLAAANLDSDNVLILLGNGDGSFGAASNFSVGKEPREVQVGEVNRDGNLDLVVANSGDTVSVLLGNGDGTFGSASILLGGTGPRSVKIGDLNGDGILDLALANITSNNVSVRYTDGIFGEVTNYAVANGPSYVTMGDFDRDGNLDLATSHEATDQVSVLIGNGDGTFGTATQFPAGDGSFSLAMVDFNRDGNPDLVTADPQGNTFSVLLGDGAGSFGSPSSFRVGENPESITFGDFNQDGKPDIVTADAASDTVSVLLNDPIVSAALTIEDNDQKISITPGDPPTEAGPTSGTFVLTLNAASSSPLTINFTSAGTAANPEDYSFTAGTGITALTDSSLTIAAGVTEAILNVVPIDDPVIDAGETVQVTLVSRTNYTVDAANNTASLSILDNDRPPTIEFSQGSYQVNENGILEGVAIALTRSGDASGTSTVEVVLSDGTATGGEDFNSATQTIAFAADQKTVTFTVPITDDSIVEATENLTLTLANPSTGTEIGTRDIATLEILDNDIKPGDTALTLTFPSDALAYSENDAPTIIDSGARLEATGDFLSWENGSLTVSLIAGGTTRDRLSIENQGSVAGQIGISGTEVTFAGTAIATFTGGTARDLTISFNENANVAAIEALLQAIAYANVSEDPTTDSRTVQFLLVDRNGNTSNTGTQTINVTAVNDDPVLETKGILTLKAGETGEIATSLLQISDVDNEAAEITYTLTALPSNGSLLLDGAALIVNSTFTQAEIDSGNLAYIHNGSNTPADSFRFTATDGSGGTIEGEIFEISITPNNPNPANLPRVPIAPTTGNGELDRQDPDCTCPPLPLSPQINFALLNAVPITEDNDTIFGGNGSDALQGIGGNDLLQGEGGNDTLIGGKGSFEAVGSRDRDLIFGNTGNDLLQGSEGEDILYGGQDNDVAFGGKDNDLIYGDRGSDTVMGDLGNDRLFGGPGNPNLAPEDGSDLLYGGFGNDYIQGNQKDDSLSGGEGNDTARGGMDNDLIHGDMGDDLLYGDRGNDWVCAGEGDDTVFGGTGSDLPIGWSGERDTLCGGAGNDWMNGNEGEDKLNGGLGNDTLRGGKDNDTIIGGSGDDVIWGDLGNDLLTGGDGSDAFVLRLGDDSDAIADFSKGSDWFGLADGLTFAQLTITDSSDGALINLGSELLALVLGVDASAIGQDDFFIVG